MNKWFNRITARLFASLVPAIIVAIFGIWFATTGIVGFHQGWETWGNILWLTFGAAFLALAVLSGVVLSRPHRENWRLVYGRGFEKLIMGLSRDGFNQVLHLPDGDLHVPPRNQ